MVLPSFDDVIHTVILFLQICMYISIDSSSICINYNNITHVFLLLSGMMIHLKIFLCGLWRTTITGEMQGMVVYAHCDAWSIYCQAVWSFTRKDDLDRGVSRFSSELGSDGTAPCHWQILNIIMLWNLRDSWFRR